MPGDLEATSDYTNMCAPVKRKPLPHKDFSAPRRTGRSSWRGCRGQCSRRRPPRVAAPALLTGSMTERGLEGGELVDRVAPVPKRCQGVVPTDVGIS